MRVQTLLLDFFNTHSHHLRNIVFIGRNVHQRGTKNQVRICTGTVVAIESQRRNRKGKGATQRRLQIGRIYSGQGFLDFCLSTLGQAVILCASYAACCVKISTIPRKLNITDAIPSIYLTRTSLTVVVKTRSSRHCMGNVWCSSINQYRSIYSDFTHIISILQMFDPFQSIDVEAANGKPARIIEL